MKSKKQQLQQDDNVLDDLEIFKNKSQDVFPRWQELKPLGKNIHRRSYHTCVCWDQYLYVYGGYETNEGILEDFSQIPIPSSTRPFTWSQVYALSEERRIKSDFIGPGPLRNHTAVVHGDKMYMLGGKETLIHPTGKLWIFDFKTEEWQAGPDALHGDIPIALEGHSMCLKDSEEPKLIVFGGFYSEQGYVASVLQYDITTAQWELLHDGLVSTPSTPKGRAASGSLIYQGSLYVFGGNNAERRFGDFWKFDLESKQWGQITTEQSPGTRSSTILVQHPQGILLFGGIHDITHEKNDIWIFRNNNWIVIEEDNSRRQTNDDQLNDSAFDKASQGRPQKKEKGGKEFMNRSFVPQEEQFEKTTYKGRNESPKRSSLKNLQSVVSTKQVTEANNTSQLNNMDELKKRRQQQKKMQLLAEFELNDDEKEKYRNSSPTTEQIKNSINLIMNQDKGQQGSRKVQSPMGKKQVMQASLMGKKPCARDGHTAVLAGDQMIVFGGDRNLMSFNDLYAYSMGLQQKDKEK